MLHSDVAFSGTCAWSIVVSLGWLYKTVSIRFELVSLTSLTPQSQFFPRLLYVCICSYFLKGWRRFRRGSGGGALLLGGEVPGSRPLRENRSRVALSGTVYHVLVWKGMISF